MQKSIEIMKNHILHILGTNNCSIYLFGSVCLNDFQLGWSDIDILCLTENPISEEKSQQLLNLRQKLLNSEPDNNYYRSFEGAILTLNKFLTNDESENVVYWGTSGQKITKSYYLDSFSIIELLDSGILIHGNDVRYSFIRPTYKQLFEEVKKHYHTIRKYAVLTDENLYSAGWILDISRGIYTIRTGSIISKTKAGEWAVKNNLYSEKEIMENVLSIRKEPLKYKNDKTTKEWLKNLGPHIQRYADILESEIFNANII